MFIICNSFTHSTWQQKKPTIIFQSLKVQSSLAASLSLLVFSPAISICHSALILSVGANLKKMFSENDSQFISFSFLFFKLNLFSLVCDLCLIIIDTNLIYVLRKNCNQPWSYIIHVTSGMLFLFCVQSLEFLVEHLITIFSLTTKVLLMLIIEHTQVDPHCYTFCFLFFCFHSYFLFPTKHFLINRFSNQHCFFNFKLFFQQFNFFNFLIVTFFISVLFHSSILNVFVFRICFSLSVNLLLSFVPFYFFYVFLFFLNSFFFVPLIRDQHFEKRVMRHLL